jgi:excisionase family DNA binding protein
MPRSGAPFATAGATCSLSSRDTFAEARVRAAVADAMARAETRSAEEAARLRQRWPTEFRDGARGAFLTPAEACEVLRVGRTKLYELIGARKLKAVALGGKTLIARAEIEQFLSELPSIQMRADRGVRNVAP